jgi:hypothetical protein
MIGGSSVAMALPLLDCLLNTNGTALAATGQPIPTRFGTYFYGCGLTDVLWVPDKVGADYDIKSQLSLFEPLKKKLNVLSGLRVVTDGKPNHQHWTGTAAITTGIAPTKDLEFDSVTIDQTIAAAIGRNTRFKSLEVACNGGRRTTFSSLGGANANPPETSALGLYTRLFGQGFQDPSKADWKPDPEVMLSQSVLSVVAEDRQRLIRNLGAADRARMDQYFTSVRQLESTLAAELRRPEIVAKVSIPDAPEDMRSSNSIPELRRVTPVFAKLLALALATDQTRVFNMAYSDPASGLFMPGDANPFHKATHEEPVDPKLGFQPITSQFGAISLEGYATLLTELDAIQQGDGTLLDHMTVMAYTDSSDAKIHAIEGIPVLLAGSASGRMKTGIHVAGAGSPVSRVGLTLQQTFGMSVSSWGEASLATNRSITEIMV